MLRLAGGVTLLLAGVPALLQLLSDDPVNYPRLAIWSAALVLFGGAFWAATEKSLPRITRREVFLLVVQTGAAFVMLYLVCTGLEWTLLALTAAQLALHSSLRSAMGFVLAQIVLLALVLGNHYPRDTVYLFTGIVLVFEVLLVFLAHLAGSQTRARAELARAHAELAATQELLAESTRAAERIRISRDMHDLLGHHLTALSLNLEVAAHKEEREADVYLEKAQAITKTMLADVRELVSDLRSTGTAVDVAAAVRTLVQGVPAPAVQLDLPQMLEVEEADRAQALLRCVQEIVTNAMRHSGANTLTLTLRGESSGVFLHARDDGRGARSFHGGQGLGMMRERVEGLGGRLELSTAPGQGVTVEMWLPCRSSW